MSTSNSPGSILFLCVANSARSQMSEGLGRWLQTKREVLSAGSKPGHLNPFAVQAMDEIGIDISSHVSKGLGDIDVASVGTVITLCADEVCPVFPHLVEKFHWAHPDPGGATDEETLASFRRIRDAIADRLAAWLDAYPTERLTHRKRARESLTLHISRGGFSQDLGDLTYEVGSRMLSESSPYPQLDGALCLSLLGDARAIPVLRRVLSEKMFAITNSCIEQGVAALGLALLGDRESLPLFDDIVGINGNAERVALARRVLES